MTTAAASPFGGRLRRQVGDWLMERQTTTAGAPRAHRTYPWWKVMCLTGVDYFSTLGYQPGIAVLAAGLLSPFATLVLILVTLFGALPMYRRVAELSPHGDGSISLLEDLLPRWRGKALVLCLLGFAATSFVITITLSAADAAAHIVENPLVPEVLHHPLGVTLLLLAALGAVLLKGFREAIGLAVAIVAVYLALNVVIVGWGIREILTHPALLSNWRSAVFAQHGDLVSVIAICMLLFPKLALGLSGFETGVAVMPLVKGDEGEPESAPVGRIRNTKRLLTTAAIIMSVLLIGSSMVTALLIPLEAFQPGREANGRALAYLAHEHLGEAFGTIYDISTIAILWFAGASAMAGLLNLVPRYLPRYGMAPEWARATRPLVVLFTAVTFVVTFVFDASVDTQAGAYATGVLTLMTSAAIAVAIWAWRQGRQRIPYLGIAIVFGYTTAANIIERPEGIKIASFFIVSIIVTSLVSRVLRSTELRIHGVELDPEAEAFLHQADSTIRIIANRPDSRTEDEYEAKLREARASHHLPERANVLFLEIDPGDASEFSNLMTVHGVQVGPYKVLRCSSPAVPNAIAALLLHVRDKTGHLPHAYFGWTEGNPIAYLLKFLAFGEGDTAPVTREVLRQTEDNPSRRPRIHVG